MKVGRIVMTAGSVAFASAYGGETNISYPPRLPAPQPWNIDWQVKIRYRAQTTGIVGMDLAAMMGGAGGGQAQGR